MKTAWPDQKPVNGCSIRMMKPSKRIGPSVAIRQMQPSRASAQGRWGHVLIVLGDIARCKTTDLVVIGA
jgi:hypothetical protein